MANLQVLLYIPNIIALDGYVARKVNQTSAFGAWLDVVVDNLGRGMIWCRVFSLGFLAASLEWLTFACTHQKGTAWKNTHLQDPLFVRTIMANNFKTPLGIIAVGSLHVLPIWLYGYYFGVLAAMSIPYSVQLLGIGLLSAGRALCGAVEIWYVWSHVLYLCSDEANRSPSPDRVA